MRALIVGLGIQGRKRLAIAGSEAVASVDPVQPDATFKSITEVPLDRYDAALVSTPDAAKIDLLGYLLQYGKHVMVEKPLLAPDSATIERLAALARSKGAVCYTAYNHRFEPHYRRMGHLIASGELGAIHSCRMFYGNGTARLVRDSGWRDRGAGVLPDLGSHLLDTCRFWFGDIEDRFAVSAAHRFENTAPDHVVIANENSRPRMELEMTLLMWRNNFTCDILAEKGSAHIESLCKWGPATFTRRTRVLPSGRPPEERTTLVQEDPTWALEYAHFKHLCESGATTDLANDLWLLRTLTRLSRQVAGEPGTA
jgi:scyllo-inositol 2-dehydrogenase (NADP+)